MLLANRALRNFERVSRILMRSGFFVFTWGHLTYTCTYLYIYIENIPIRIAEDPQLNLSDLRNGRGPDRPARPSARPTPACRSAPGAASSSAASIATQRARHSSSASPAAGARCTEQATPACRRLGGLWVRAGEGRGPARAQEALTKLAPPPVPEIVAAVAAKCASLHAIVSSSLDASSSTPPVPRPTHANLSSSSVQKQIWLRSSLAIQ